MTISGSGTVRNRKGCLINFLQLHCKTWGLF